ncbi:guanine deaminase [Alcaligenes faecalis]|uniref:guanine deaminase n=1 Tax=Alcaligenes faecalis TaxID=511 RepID=UPI000A2DD7FB|nr:guanine deaminase [Alcaligenes faecalis]OSZ36516.1 guanine deaminase [Alcaligenes faecalis]OSZ46615.1 guanine deaminase [Alcaligenes faecalis]
MTTSLHSACAYRAQLLYFVADPATLEDPSDAVRYHSDGLLLVNEQGQIQACGDWSELSRTLPADTQTVDLSGKIIMPGMIDTHLHFPQTDIIASPSSGLLPWLETYTFPTEGRFGDSEHAREVAGVFLDELLRNGTTTALVYGSVHRQSVDAFFEESHERNLRMIAGKVMMDRNCPDYLQDTAESGARDSEDLIKRWHGKGRQLYALTPRFAPTSTPEQLAACGELARAYPDVFLQTHVAENKDEIKWVSELFPKNRSYLDVYDSFGLLRPRAIYGHSIWLDEQDRARMHETGSIAAHCPTSNLFLASGLFDFQSIRQSKVLHTLATDVGGGTSFSMLRTMNEAHKVARLNNYHLTAASMFYMATEGAARALDLQGQIGTLAPGAEADFIVMDPKATPLMARRSTMLNSLEEQLFMLALLGDDRCIQASYSAGRCVHQRDH